MKLEDLKVISDEDLTRYKAAIEDEQNERTETRKRDAIARIKETAAAVGITVHIDGLRGRPPKPKGLKREANDNRPAVEPEKAVKGVR